MSVTKRAAFATALLVVLGVINVVSATSGAPPSDKTPTVEDIAKTVIYIYSPRAELSQIRRNGIERGRLTRTNEDGRTEEFAYERRFIRGESSEKDKVRFDQKMPSMDFALIYGEGSVWGIINGASFTPREDASAPFLSQIRHDVDALLRYKENNATLALVGKEKQKNIDLWVLDLIDQNKNKTRYYISAKYWRVLWLEYEETFPGKTKPAQFKKQFHDYRYAQGTLVPFRTLLYADGKSLQETRVLTITYGVRMEDSLFKNPGPENTAAIASGQNTSGS